MKLLPMLALFLLPAYCQVACANDIPFARLVIGSSVAKVYYGSHTIYIFKTDPDTPAEDIEHRIDGDLDTILPVVHHGELALENCYVRVGDQTVQLKFNSNNKKVLTVLNHDSADTKAGTLIPKGPGTAIITISTGKTYVSIPFRVIQLPIMASQSNDDIIKIMGLPDRRSKRYISWPNHETIDGLYYSTASRRSVSGMTVEHWIYRKYPGLVLRVDGVDTNECKMPEWEHLNLFTFVLEHHEN